ncbi:ABC transporter substrate-binding protein [Alkalihalobacillus alcalophilus ATCC 27647 = CGMCC 1.3604]|uniref:ABC transporter substrate-binding protein n=1 Tax=Alkalihalobacillus alcalophilus ATCC 27647 = CGMCC 1.3604 TaxID=1218173 RepID=A0A094YRA9_ALKAL|nr:ABC transporter substrate-binding protein [Alkalihalobacillus alcalophilus ATCC 27647 = CGMCC 1.3604]
MSVGLLAVALVACGNDGESENTNDETNTSEQSQERVLTDTLGNEVTIPANPERIIASYLEDSLVALDVEPVAQWSVHDGASIQDYLQGDLDGVPLVPHDLPFEAVSSFEPDLIIVDSPSLVEGGKYEQYSKIAPTYVIGEEENSDWRINLTTIAEILNKEEEAEQVLAEYDAKAEQAKDKIQAEISDESAAAIWLVNDSFFIVNKNLSSGSVMYGDLGLGVPSVVEEISASDAANWSSISLEKLVELDADHLFLINSDTGIEDSAINESLWKNIPAVQKGQVYEFGPDTSWLYQGAIANGQIIDDILNSLID